MADKTGIEWTDATWPVVQGCDYESPGCKHCYVPPMLWRLMHNPNPVISAPLAGLVEIRSDVPVFTGKVAMREDRLNWPLAWKKPRRIFVPSHGDIFHEAVTDAFLDKIFAVMALCPQHTFQVLTKRAARMRAYLGAPGGARGSRHAAIVAAARDLVGTDAMPEHFAPVGADAHNIWTGFSAEDQPRFDARWADAKHCQIGRGKLFLSGEPLLGPLDLRFNEDHCDLCDGTGMLARWPKGKCHVCGGRGRLIVSGPKERAGYFKLDWVITGGESGQDARPMHPDWARSLRDQCQAAGVPFFFKQWGAWAPIPEGYERARESLPLRVWDGKAWTDDGGQCGDWLARVGKKAAGRTLDGVEHSAFPGVSA